jgi:AcrR family transcriptional regulator
LENVTNGAVQPAAAGVAPPASRVDKRGDPAATQARILAAATEEFAEYGIAGARVDRIALNAKSNKQLIYRYFGTKQGLYEAVVDRLVTSARASIEEDRSRSPSFLESRQFVAGPSETRTHWARLQSWEGLTDAVESPELDAKRADNIRLLREWIEADQQAGRITKRLSSDIVVAMVLFSRIVPASMPKVLHLMIDDRDPREFQRSWLEFLRETLAPDDDEAPSK